MHTERFAPSPTGPLHLGHAFSALTAWQRAQAAGGRLLLRIEDIDQSRARAEWEAQILDDLGWLGLDWPKPVLRQSQRMADYRMVVEQLWADRMLFACTCTRREVEAALSAPQEGAPLHGPDGLIYPGTCRAHRYDGGPPPGDAALRLDMARAAARVGPVRFTETGAGPNGETGTIAVAPERMMREIGDVVLARRGWGTSYHLAVVLDDAHQRVTHVTRGRDLFEATAIHVLLQRLLGLPVPVYHHHRLIRDAAGRRLAKRDDARAIAKYRAEGASPRDIRELVGLAATPAAGPR
ncbi:tRNA glutamyl-Q(34) synthetase GluQRS [Rhodobacteraceae bacterium 2CG4]|uniref:tRNA glutamyl-Q(34) synthetase GluQRS n=1 Tax=Halovulum marinum TaxID=2662447 RepID=A0A6L5Z0C6_9RHOB|nr:tRNA glutamyl-Q(34) synthetase GluQRS [Halovulum marinum]MSU89991.1 tRNA glutamyl-Q(34) synthetase GluQRS [Halovulum marinum]